MVKDLVLRLVYVKVFITELFLSYFLESLLHFLNIHGVYFHGVEWFTSPDAHREEAAHTVYDDPSGVSFIIGVYFNF